MDFKDKLKATAKNVEGKIQEAASHATGDPEDKIKGRAKQDEAAAMYAQRNTEQAMTPSQASTPEYASGQSDYPASGRDPYNYPEPSVTPEQTPASGATPAQSDYPASGRDPYNYPQENTAPGQAPMSEPPHRQSGYGRSERDDTAQ